MLVYLIVSQVLFICSLLPWIIIWGMSFMSFDAGIGLYNSLFVLTITVYPLAIIICSILAWIFRVKKKRFAIIINLVPLLWVISFISFMYIVD